MKQQILFGKEAREKLVQGINITNDAVKVTLGPQGRNVVSNHVHAPVWSSKDGIKIIREVNIPDQAQNAGVKLLRDASAKTAQSAGDATTTTCIIATALVNGAQKLINEGESPVKLRKAIEQGTKEAVQWIKDKAVQIQGDAEKVRHIATISANNNEEIGNLISDAFIVTGAEGTITLQESFTGKTEIEIMGGYYYSKGMVHPYFITNHPKAECHLEEPFVLIYDKTISKIEDIITPLNYAATNATPILIVCNSIEGEALATILINVRDRGLKACVVPCPEGGAKRLAMMEDMAIFTGGEVVSEDLGKMLTKDEFKPEFLGRASKAIIGKDKTVIINGQGEPEKISQRAEQIKEQIAEATSDYEKEILRNRAASIGKGVAVLKIGAATDVERGDKMDLAEDAILAVRSALEEGYLPGGGVSYYKIACSLKSDLLKTALTSPLKQIMGNSGEEISSEHLDRIEKSRNSYGFNARTGKYGNLVSDGVIDAAKVVRNAIENAASVAQMFCSTEVLICEVED